MVCRVKLLSVWLGVGRVGECQVPVPVDDTKVPPLHAPHCVHGVIWELPCCEWGQVVFGQDCIKPLLKLKCVGGGRAVSCVGGGCWTTGKAIQNHARADVVLDGKGQV